MELQELANGKILSGPGRTYLPVTTTSAGAATAKATTGTTATASSAKQLPFHMPPKKIMKAVGQAVKEWRMIEEGDKLLLGLSGGKDSLALLHILLALQVGLIRDCVAETLFSTTVLEVININTST